jgi:nucleotidyltransferase substrate binding protein (TIGR01987 family)
MGMNVQKAKFDAFGAAARQFFDLISIDLDTVFLGHPNNELLIDGLKNGQAQKFELTTELCWKALKSTLYNTDGIDESSPKKVIKAYFLAGYLDEVSYQLLHDCIDDRNKLSHIYDTNEFNVIIGKFSAYANLFLNIHTQLKSDL